MNTKKFRITKVTADSVYLRWVGYSSQMKGLSIRVPVNEFVESYKRLDQHTCEKKETKFAGA